jgi:outer membrane protein assembly factor BamB
VYAFFGKGGGLFCYSKDGDLVWNKPLGDFAGPWGTAACPMLLDDLVIQNCDAEANARLVAFDKHTGNEVWSTRREDYRGWGTPFLLKQGGRTQILVNGQTGVRSYDPTDGKELWFCSSEAGRGEPTPTPGGDGRVFVVNGLRGPMYAVKPDGKGDVSQSKRLWSSPRNTGRDLPSPGVIGDAVLVMAMKGVLACYDANSGKQAWDERIGGNFAASPVVVNDKALFLAEEGEVVVIDPKASPHVVARNTFGAPNTEIFRASPAAHEGQWLIRSNTALYCVGAK